MPATASATVNGSAMPCSPAQVRLQRRQGRHRGAQRRPLERLQPLQRPIQHRRQDFAHQVAAGDAAGDGDARDLLPGRLVLAHAQGDQVGQRLQRGAEPHAGARPARRGTTARAGRHAERRLRVRRTAARATPSQPGGTGAGLPLPGPSQSGRGADDAVEELGAVVVAAHPQVRAPVQPHGVESRRTAAAARRGVDHGGVAEDDRHLARRRPRRRRPGRPADRPRSGRSAARCVGSRPASTASDGDSGPIGSYWSTMRGNCCQASSRYSGFARASSIGRHHWLVRRSMMPVEAAAETLTTSKLPVRKPAARAPCGRMRSVRCQSARGQAFLVLDEMAERVANRPGAADQLA